MKKIKILYMGTTIFSAYILEALINASFDVVALVSQPDRRVGRKQEIKYTATKEVALKNNIKVIAYDNINEHVQEIKDLDFDMIITCAFGQKVGLPILEMPRLKAINVHASLLPLYRGGAPIHYAIINGDEYTGNTIMYMEEGLDTGAMLAQSKIKIDLEDTTSILFDKLMVDGADLLLKTLPPLINNEITPIPQIEEEVSYAYNIPRSFEYIDFNEDVLKVYNHIRGLLSVPGCYCNVFDKSMKFHQVAFAFEKHEYPIGYVKIDNKDYFKIYALNGYIKVYEFQLSGKQKIKYQAYVNGNKLEIQEGLIINEK